MAEQIKWKIHLVPHTHWDKEWYFTKQDSDVLLAKNINNYLEIIKERKDFKSFTYDGQFSIIDDYLEYYPENKELIKNLVKTKKLIIGPWYTQPDFFNSSSESVIRNLLYGIKLSTELGNNYLNVAYVPDSFGHNAQMPQIYKQFGLNEFIYWRGIRNSELEKGGTLHWWKGIDGTKIKAYNFLLGYWSLGSKFPYLKLNDQNYKEVAKQFLEDTKEMIDELKKYCKNTDNKILLPLGGDQAPITKFLPDFINEVNNLSNDDWLWSTYDNYFDDIKLNNELTILENELKSPAKSRIHKTIGSQRYDLKLKVKELEQNLYNGLEPLASYFWLLGGTYPFAMIDKIVKLLLLCLAHDSLGGCNSDNTNDDIENRLSRANDLVLSETVKISKEIVADLKLDLYDIFIFNPTLQKVIKTQKVKLFTKFKSFEIFDNGKKIPFFLQNQIFNNNGSIVSAAVTGEQQQQIDGFYESNICIASLELNAFSHKVLKIKEVNSLNTIESKRNIIENDFYKIEVNHNAINIFDKLNQKNYLNQLRLEAQIDLGDSYDFSPATDENPIISNLAKLSFSSLEQTTLQTIVLESEFKVSGYENDFYQNWTMRICLDHSSNIKLNLNTKNVSKNIKWRILIDSELENDFSFANQTYSTIKRKVDLQDDINVWKSEHWFEKPVAIETNESFCYIKTTNSNYGFLTFGQNEYEVLNKKTLALTLYRTTDLLGRNNLLWRPGRASGVSETLVETFGSRFNNQKLEFNFAVSIDKTDNWWLKAEVNNLNLIYYQVQNHNTLFKKFDRFLFIKEKVSNNVLKSLELNNKDFIVKVVKLSWDKKHFIIRGFNPLSKNIEFNFKNKLNFSTTDLLENVKEKNINALIVKPFEIVTIMLDRYEVV